MLQFDISADVRNNFGKGASRSIRREGQTPAILYGPKTEALALMLDAKSFTKILISLQRGNAVFNMEISDGSSTSKRHVIVKEIQTEPVSGDLVHADFLEVKLEVPMVFNVPVRYKGLAKGVELGGEMHVALTSVALKGLILDLPDFVDLDVSTLDIGDKLYCSDLAIPSAVEILNDPGATCVAIVVAAKAPVEEEEEGVGEGEEAEASPAGDEGATEAAA